ncbi:MAG: hypothetical protein K2X27_14520 [Candidatus Obscuribacterales bacterium]|nr:hypothetical protein [Candidatus Obscuribacterales bacterium]
MARVLNSTSSLFGSFNSRKQSKTKAIGKTVQLIKLNTEDYGSRHRRENRDFFADPAKSLVIEILQRTGKLGKAEYADLNEIAANLKQEPEEVLKRGQFVAAHDLKLAKDAAKFIDQDLICLELLLKGFETASQKGISLIDGLRFYGFGW